MYHPSHSPLRGRRAAQPVLLDLSIDPPKPRIRQV